MPDLIVIAKFGINFVGYNEIYSISTHEHAVYIYYTLQSCKSVPGLSTYGSISLFSVVGPVYQVTKRLRGK
jgi:hypothetical protein